MYSEIDQGFFFSSELQYLVPTNHRGNYGFCFWYIHKGTQIANIFKYQSTIFLPSKIRIMSLWKNHVMSLNSFLNIATGL